MPLRRLERIRGKPVLTAWYRTAELKWPNEPVLPNNGSTLIDPDAEVADQRQLAEVTLARLSVVTVACARLVPTLTGTQRHTLALNTVRLEVLK